MVLLTYFHVVTLLIFITAQEYKLNLIRKYADQVSRLFWFSI